MTTNSKLFQSALSLPECDRAELAASLIRSLDSTADADANEAWAAEIASRINSIDNSEVKLIPWDEVIQEMCDRSNG